jgi:Autographiviridae endonuclease VII
MYERQGGKCAICPEFKPKGKLVVDHNHTTGKVRKLLCLHCNTLIGYAREDIAILLSAVVHLQREQHPNLDDA